MSGILWYGRYDPGDNMYRGGQINRDFSVSFFLVPYHRQFKRYRADFLYVHSCVSEVTFPSI